MKIRSIFWLLLAFQGSLAAQHDHYAGYVRQADSLFRLEAFATAAQRYSLAFQTYGGRAYPKDRFKAARAWARAGVADSAFFHLGRLLEKTDFLDDESTWRTEPDFAALQNDLRWTRLQLGVRLKKERRQALKNDPLAIELEEIYRLDQWYRQHWDSVSALHGRESPEFDDFLRRTAKQDSLNVLRVIQILDERGWPGPEEVGHTGNKAIFLVIQHADLPVQMRYLPLMRQAVAADKASAADLAYLEDRVLMRQGRPQRYGSQFVPDKNTGAWVLYPVEDPPNLDKRRAGVGLGPIQADLDRMGATWEH